MEGLKEATKTSKEGFATMMLQRGRLLNKEYWWRNGLATY